MPRPKSENIRTHVMLTQSQYARMQDKSAKSGYSISELMRRAVDLYLVKTKKVDG
jgi:hypothetical protein